jgi:hypothetical protein
MGPPRLTPHVLIQDVRSYHRPQSSPRVSPPTPHTHPRACSPKQRARTSASHGHISVRTIRTLADSSSTARQATKPFSTGTLPCELSRGEHPQGTRPLRLYLALLFGDQVLSGPLLHTQNPVLAGWSTGEPCKTRTPRAETSLEVKAQRYSAEGVVNKALPKAESHRERDIR